MKGKKKFPKSPGFLRSIVAENVKALMEIRFQESGDKPRALAAATGPTGAGGISKSTIQRILSAESGATVDNLEAIADALDVSLYQLLIPALNAANPQIVSGATEAEEKAFKRWRRRQDATGKHPALKEKEGAGF